MEQVGIFTILFEIILLFFICLVIYKRVKKYNLGDLVLNENLHSFDKKDYKIVKNWNKGKEHKTFTLVKDKSTLNVAILFLELGLTLLTLIIYDLFNYFRIL